MGWTIEGSIPSRIERSFSSPKHPDQLWIQPSLLSNDYMGSFLEVKQPEHEIDHSLPTIAEIKNEWNYIPIAPYAFMVWTGTALPSVYRRIQKRIGNFFILQNVHMSKCTLFSMSSQSVDTFAVLVHEIHYSICTE